jgi:hypothetical protein
MSTEVGERQRRKVFRKSYGMGEKEREREREREGEREGERERENRTF